MPKHSFIRLNEDTDTAIKQPLLTQEMQLLDLLRQKDPKITAPRS